MYELFKNLPNDKAVIGKFNTEQECHKKAEELNLSAYCINLYINKSFTKVIYDTWCFKIK